MAILKDAGEHVPNKFTIAMGELIKTAREEARLSQEELAQRIYRRRETLSVIENGRSEVGTITLAAIAANTNKPLTYFYPKFAKEDLVEEQLSSEEQEILLEFRRIADAKTQQMAIGLVKQLANIDEKETEQALSEEFKKHVLTLDKNDPLYKIFKKRGLIE